MERGFQINKKAFDLISTLTKKNYSKYSLLYFKIMVLWNFDFLLKTMVLWTKLLFYGQNYGTMYRELWNFDL